jgi:hypothetical protein
MIREEIVGAVVPPSHQVLALIVPSESHRKFVWTAGRVLQESALWTRIAELNYEERKLVLKRLTTHLNNLAADGVLQQRTELHNLGYGAEIGFD